MKDPDVDWTCVGQRYPGLTATAYANQRVISDLMIFGKSNACFKFFSSVKVNSFKPI